MQRIKYQITLDKTMSKNKVRNEPKDKARDESRDVIYQIKSKYVMYKTINNGRPDIYTDLLLAQSITIFQNLYCREKNKHIYYIQERIEA